MAEADHSPDPYLLARVNVASDLWDFISDNERQLTYNQGEPLFEVADQIDSGLLGRDNGEEDHQKISESGANRLGEWLSTHGDDVSFKIGHRVSQMRDTLREGVEEE